jgi:hypothetical protein
MYSLTSSNGFYVIMVDAAGEIYCDAPNTAARVQASQSMGALAAVEPWFAKLARAEKAAAAPRRGPMATRFRARRGE